MLVSDGEMRSFGTREYMLLLATANYLQRLVLNASQSY